MHININLLFIQITLILTKKAFLRVINFLTYSYVIIRLGSCRAETLGTEAASLRPLHQIVTAYYTIVVFNT